MAVPSMLAAGLLGLILCCQLAYPAEGVLQSYFLTASPAPLEDICLGSDGPTDFDSAACMLIGSNSTVLYSYTICGTGVTILQYASGNYTQVDVSALPGGAASAAWQMSNWQAAPLDIVTLTVTNLLGATLGITALTSILNILPLVGVATVTAPAAFYDRNFDSLSNVQDYLLSNPPSAVTSFAFINGRKVTYVITDPSGIFYLFEATFSSSRRRRRLLASNDYSTQGSNCQCVPNQHPAPSCRRGSSSYPGCEYICRC